MTPRQLFGLATRLVGLVFLYHAFTNLPAGITLMAAGGMRILTGIVVLLLPFVVAYWFFRGAPPVNRIAYPSDRTALDGE